jgi:hypothetical protein
MTCDYIPTKRTAAVEPSFTAGVSEYTISQAKASWRRATLKAGLGDLKIRFSNVPVDASILRGIFKRFLNNVRRQSAK